MKVSTETDEGTVFVVSRVEYYSDEQVCTVVRVFTNESVAEEFIKVAKSELEALTVRKTLKYDTFACVPSLNVHVPDYKIEQFHLFTELK